MKQFLTLALLLLGLMSSAIAQGAKNMYESHFPTQRAKPQGRPGSKLWVEMEKGRAMVPVTATFKSGQNIRLHLKINYEGYLTILNTGSSGKPQVVYPRTLEQAQTPLPRTTDFVVPSTADHWLTFDRTKGTEKLTVIMSAQPIPDVLDYLLRKSSIPKSDSIALDVLSSTITRKTQSKDLLETRVQQSDQQATYVVAAASASRLEKPVLFRVKLKHR